MDSNLGPPLDSHFSEFFGTNVERYEDEQFNQLDMPGGDDFYDITTIFSEGAEEMDHGSLLMTEGFELQQAMNAFEVCLRYIYFNLSGTDTGHFLRSANQGLIQE